MAWREYGVIWYRWRLCWRKPHGDYYILTQVGPFYRLEGKA